VRRTTLVHRRIEVGVFGSGEFATRTCSESVMRSDECTGFFSEIADEEARKRMSA
jgi:hypothetical protein